MAIGNNNSIPTFPSRLSEPFPTTSKKQISPFQVLRHSIDPETGAVNVFVSKYSNVYKNIGTLDLLPIIGLDYYFSIELDDLIYLEIVFNRLGEAVYGKITKQQNKWTRTVRSLTSPDIFLPVYPAQIELITKYDIIAKTDELEQEKAANLVIKDATQSQLDILVTDGVLTEAEYNVRLEELLALHSSVLENIITLQNDMNIFFNGVSGVRKKQFRTFIPIADTVEIFDALLPGETLIPVPVVDPAQTLDVVLPAVSKKFKLIQMVNSDLLLADFLYNDILCKLAVPSSRLTIEEVV